MANIIDLNKRRYEEREPLLLLGFTDQHLDIIEEGMVKMIDEMVAQGWPPIWGMLAMQMGESFIAARAGMNREDVERIRSDTLRPCRGIAARLVQDLPAIQSHVGQSEARRVTDFQDAWSSAGNASELDVTKGG